MTCAALAAVDARIMMPAFANVLVFWMLARRVTTVTSPLIDWRTKWKLSLVPQMVPAPPTVNVPFAKDALPGTPVAPTSWSVHGAGSDPPPPPPAVTVTLSNVDVLSVFVATEQTTRPACTLAPALNAVLPMVVHDEPSSDTDAVTVLPLRTRRTHAGGVLNDVARNVVSAPVAERVMNS